MRLLLPFIVTSIFFVRSYAQEKEFVLVKHEKDIAIYERWIKFPKSNPPVDAREVKGEFYFNNSIDEAVRLLQDEEKIQQWQSHVSEFKVFKGSDSSRWQEYSYHDIPWPVSDQDHLLTYTIVKRTNDELFITFESFEDDKLAPVRKGVTRMKLSGSWSFARIDSSRVKATYRILSMPSNIPKFLTDPIIRNNMVTTIQEFVVLMDSTRK